MSENERATTMPPIIAKHPSGVNVRWGAERGNNIFASLKNGDALPPTAIKRGAWWVFDCYVHESVVCAVPYVSQIGAGAAAPNDCGQACVAMLARMSGVNVTVDEITQFYAAQGSGWRYGTYTSLAQAQAYLASVGIKTTEKQIGYGALPDGVGIALVAYSQLSRLNAYDQGFYNAPNAYHFVVFAVADEANVMVNDPLWPDAERGQFRRWTRAEWARAFTGDFLQLEVSA
jgi:hypothetical protein